MDARLAAAVDEPERGLRADPASPRIAIIDIGSNSVRLVVYHGLSRAAPILFNEKVMAGLGRGVAATGVLAPDTVEVAVAALARFALLARAMQVDSLRAVATAAVREAVNGAEFVARVRAETGLEVEVIDGETEARAAAFGVIAGIPDANGVVGDLGGGSLELVRVAGGEAHERVSLKLGALRLDAARRKGGARALARFVTEALEAVDWQRLGTGRPFYMVGGSWRALAQLHMHLTDWPLPVVHHHVMEPDAASRLVRTLARISLKSLRDVPSISSARVPQLPGAAHLLRAVTERLSSSAIIASAYGLREGLLYLSLPEAAKAEDPLLAAARAEAHRAGRFSDGRDSAVGDVLLAWTDGLLGSEPAPLRRIRQAACLLADVAWRAHPDLRAERGFDIALHGNWVGIEAGERAMLALALFVANGGAVPHPLLEPLARLASPEALARARLWGLALRLAQRLGGGTAEALAGSAIGVAGRELRLSLPRASAALYGEAVARRHRLLAEALQLEPVLRLA
ncbi:Ppx/GppA family phosphatase [Thermaurantiacus tibetensis]|uniref:Ppx/GppA family phosphatase n=1 Tax=Thermaurantiacus tibetensis TaxID=2759035 RepID=UPI00189055FD|nr:Ppx/GppA family phosphatase [Thermaurantiacus tibetensis]